MRLPCLILLAALLPIVPGCGRVAEEAPSTSSSLTELDGTEWVLASVDGHAPIAGSHVSMRFEKGTMGGYGGCNWYGSSYTRSGVSLRFGAIEATARACGEPDGVMRQEADLHAALRAVTAHELAPDRLELSGAGRVLVFTRRTPLPMNPADLPGTRWTLRRVRGEPVAAEPAITLELGDGTMRGFAGCRTYEGTYSAVGDRLQVSSIVMGDTECPAGEEALAREHRFLDVLGEVERYRLAGDTLEMTTAGGRSMELVRSGRQGRRPRRRRGREGAATAGIPRRCRISCASSSTMSTNCTKYPAAASAASARARSPASP